jgi:hypothetical protein
MPRKEDMMPVNLTPEHHSEQALVAQTNAINTDGRTTHDAILDADRKAEERKAYDKKHADLLALPASEIVKYYIYFIALAAVYFLDLALFGPTSEYWVMLATQNPLVVSLAKFIAPLCFLAAEVLISLKIVESNEHTSGFEKHTAGGIGWIALGFLVALVMPLVAGYTAMTVQASGDESTPILMVAILGVISFACHILVLFGGRLAHDAKTYLLFVCRRGQKTAAEDSARRTVQRSLKRLEARFIPYAHHLRRHNAAHNPVPAGPFDSEVVEILRRQFPQFSSGSGRP